MKAVKNPVEIDGFHQSHLRDSVAHCQFLLWIEEEVKSRNLTEIEAASQMELFRSEQANFVGLSFETISAVEEHAALCHYAPTVACDGTITKDSMYLLDSGAQYLDGTTDVTRTMHFGQTSDYQKECFTAVLKSHIALASLIFPENTSGYRLDSIARQALWELGLDYAHGTGHGIGHYLNVHEGPAGFHFRETASEGIKAGMVLTIEPGYYEDGQFGIRIENAYLVVRATTKYPFKDKALLTFEPLTLVPIQRKLIDPSMLTAKEVNWLNRYHVFVREKLEHQINQSASKEPGGRNNISKEELLVWLIQQCEPI